MPENFGFSVIDKNLNFTKNKDIQALFTKWDLMFETHYFNFDKMATDMDHPHLLKSLLENDGVLSKLNLNKHINKCEVEELNCTIMNMNFLDRFKNQNLEPRITRECGRIIGCSPDIKDGIQIGSSFFRSNKPWHMSVSS